MRRYCARFSVMYACFRCVRLMCFFSHVDGHRLWTGRHVRHTLAALASIRLFVFVLPHFKLSVSHRQFFTYPSVNSSFFLLRAATVDVVIVSMAYVTNGTYGFSLRPPVLRAHPHNSTPRRATPYLPTDDAPNFTVLPSRFFGT